MLLAELIVEQHVESYSSIHVSSDTSAFHVNVPHNIARFAGNESSCCFRPLSNKTKFTVLVHLYSGLKEFSTLIKVENTNE